MIWVALTLGGFCLGLIGFVVYLSRKGGADGQVLRDLKGNIQQTKVDEDRSAAIDADVALSRERARQWLRHKNTHP